MRATMPVRLGAAETTLIDQLIRIGGDAVRQGQVLVEFE